MITEKKLDDYIKKVGDHKCVESHEEGHTLDLEKLEFTGSKQIKDLNTQFKSQKDKDN